MTRVSWRSSIQSRGQSDTETSNAARANDNIAQACRDFLSCRFDPDDLETQLKLSHPRGVEQTVNDELSPVPETEP